MPGAGVIGSGGRQNPGYFALAYLIIVSFILGCFSHVATSSETAV